MTKRRTVSTQFFIGIVIVIISCAFDNDAHANSAPIAQKKLLNKYMYNTKSVASTTLPTVAFITPRGGGSADYDSEYDYDESEEESEEEEEIIQRKTKLSSSAVKASEKAKSKKVKASKKIVNASLGTEKKSKKISAPVVKKPKKKLIYIPYILKAMLNPFTVFTMTKGYFASLFNIDYLQQDSSQTLRSALQEKAKKESGGPKRPGRVRKMKRGQAKTLSDLPQLNT